MIIAGMAWQWNGGGTGRHKWAFTAFFFLVVRFLSTIEQILL